MDNWQDSRSSVSRRAFLRIVGLGGTMLLAAACAPSTPATPTAAPAAAPTTAAAAAAKPPAAAAAPTEAPKPAAAPAQPAQVPRNRQLILMFGGKDGKWTDYEL